jgi:hypothetical protein
MRECEEHSAKVFDLVSSCQQQKNSSNSFPVSWLTPFCQVDLKCQLSVAVEMNCFVSLLVILLLIGDTAFASDMYSSVAELERLYLKEQQAGLRLESLLDLIKRQTTAIDQYVKLPFVRDSFFSIHAHNQHFVGIWRN